MNTTLYNENIIKKGYEKIVVVGPHRSGTTFTCKAFAQTLAYKEIDEAEFKVNDVYLFRELFSEKNIVLQAPSLTHRIHTLVGKNDLVVFMVRRWSDIVKSVYRKNGKISNWVFVDTMYEVEKHNYFLADHKTSQIYAEHVDRNSYYLDITYKMWKYYQSALIPNSIALEYESMSEHPLWLDKEKRKDFQPKQTNAV